MIERIERFDVGEYGPLLGTVATCLEVATRQQETPEQVKDQLRTVAVGVPSVLAQVHLAWRRQPGEGRLEYDALVALPGLGTFCLGFAPEDERPWAMLAAQRWSEGELLSVDEERMRVSDATALVDFLWKDQGISRRLVNICLLRGQLSRHPHVVSEEELSKYVEQWRRTKALLTAHAFESWLSERGLTHAQFLSRAREQAAMVLLRRRLVGDVAAKFEARRAEFDQVEYVRCRFDDRHRADRAKQMLIDDGCEFWQLVDQRVLWPEVAVSRRRELPAGLAGQLFSAAAGEVLGPFEGSGSFDLVRVLGTRPATFDAATRHALEDSLLEEWLTTARAAARVAWNYGDAEI